MSTSSASAIAAMEQPPEKLSMVVIMGTTGAGKSYFINKLAGYEAVEEGASLDSCILHAHLIPAIY